MEIAGGADRISGVIAEKLGMKVEKCPANWNKYGKRAGAIRNLEMLDLEPDLVLAFHTDLNESKGTAHTVREAIKRKIKTEIYNA